METLLELPMLALQSKPTGGNRVAVITTTGGGAAMVVDGLGAAGLELVAGPERLYEFFDGFGLSLGRGRLIDLTMAGTRDGVYGGALEILLNDDGVDAVVAVVGSSGQFHPDQTVAPIIDASNTGKPLAVFIAPNAPGALDRLAASNVAAFRTPEACVDGVRALLEWRPPAIVVTGKALAPSTAELLSSVKGLDMDEVSGRQLMAAIGIATAQPVMLAEPDAEVPDDLLYPVAAKVVSPDVAHKTEAGAVALGIKEEASLRDAMAKIWQSAQKYAPHARLEGIMVEPMVDALAEVLLGFRRDAEAGPVVVLGMGGILTEIYEDAAVRPAPVSKETAFKMIEEVKGLAVIRGYRNLAKGDCDALADAVVSLSGLAEVENPQVAEAEINPLMVQCEGEGVIAVDALVRLNA